MTEIADLIAAARKVRDAEDAYLAAPADSTEEADLLAKLEAADQVFEGMKPYRLIATLSP